MISNTWSENGRNRCSWISPSVCAGSWFLTVLLRMRVTRRGRHVWCLKSLIECIRRTAVSTVRCLAILMGPERSEDLFPTIPASLTPDHKSYSSSCARSEPSVSGLVNVIHAFIQQVPDTVQHFMRASKIQFCERACVMEPLVTPTSASPPTTTNW